VQFDGPTEQGIALYEEDCRLSAVPWARAAGITDAEQTPIVITDVAMLDTAGAPCSVFDHGERMRLRIDYEVREPLDDPNIIVAFVRSDGVACCNYSTTLDGVAIDPTPGRRRVELLTPPLSLISELYKIEILVREKGFQSWSAASTAAASISETMFSTCISASFTKPDPGPPRALGAPRPRSRTREP
jgi:lipopolysaccharide transport system ATP-binding protein